MLVLVVGPSGAGKDTLLGLARQALTNDRRFRFVRRVITRSADPDGEDHEAVTPEAFAQRSFALQWRAHGLSYGIPAEVEAELADGRVMVANVSRGIIAEAAARFPVRIIQVTAPAGVLAARLAARGRETAADVSRRLSREVELPDGVVVETIVNDGAPEVGAARFVAALRGFADPLGTR
jgi:ribose 1,5-bisphosphokinase